MPGSGATQRSSHGRAVPALRRRVPSRLGRALLTKKTMTDGVRTERKDLLSETPPDPADGPPARGWARSLLRPRPTRQLSHAADPIRAPCSSGDVGPQIGRAHV